MNGYRIDKQELLNEIGAWNHFLRRRVHLIACGGTALTLLNLKESTKDVDLIVPNLDEHSYLVSKMKEMGYARLTGAGYSRGGKVTFDLFGGKTIHTTELLDSPLEAERHIVFEEFAYVYLGILNVYDILISKLFRGTQVDFEDCMTLFGAKRSEIDAEYFKKRFTETASYEVAQERVLKNLEVFLRRVEKER
ncbi:MAG: hypothetical protein JW976_00250 [Syntrophaceae bacterium]|nr:hypothetical protein [Syntrophaceae bacterium]